MPIYEFEGVRPKIAASAFIHPTSVIIGDVVIGENCFILPNVTLRGDFAHIGIGDGSNVQDNSVLHGACELSRCVLVGHGVIIHGARIGENALIGMGAIILDDVVVGEGCIVGAGALVAPRTVIPPGKVVMGIPAAITGDAPPRRGGGLESGPSFYEELGRRHAKSLREISREEAAG
ncbi:MAG: gamma carbonic anhydrase family protein [Dehalococcoidia bacterium]|nr:gamma carbonic anhydrase family protein [Dehalococcoidia bacterium]